MAALGAIALCHFHVNGGFAVIRVGAGVGATAGMGLVNVPCGKSVAKPKVER